MITEQLTPGQVIDMYRADAAKLKAHLPYLEKVRGQAVTSTFEQEGISQHSLVFPVYDGNLLRFIREAEQTVFMDKNYRYAYSRFRIRSVEDELSVIGKCTILQMDVIGGILSKYVLGGRTKASLWSEGVRNGVYAAAITKADELIHFWESETK